LYLTDILTGILTSTISEEQTAGIKNRDIIQKSNMLLFISAFLAAAAAVPSSYKPEYKDSSYPAASYPAPKYPAPSWATLHQATTRITNTPTSPSTAKLTSATSMAAASLSKSISFFISLR
ncbi:Uncharacterized protein APZ42_032132, partial [Daphnia magna]